MKASNENFINALAIFNGGSTEEVNQIVDNDMVNEIVETQETLEDFVSARGKPFYYNNETEFGNVTQWENVQREKGLRKGSLYVAEYEDKTLSFFDGE